MKATAQKIVNRPSTQVVAAIPVHVRSVPGVAQRAGSLKISSPTDSAEREAEYTAKHIMRMPAPAVRIGNAVTAKSSPHAARFAGTIRQREPERVARKMGGPATASSSVASEINAGKSSGKPLPNSIRNFMEPRFNSDFSTVRIHTGEQSAKLNRQVSAQAFTVGNQIYFGRNRFQPESGEGRELIAHELTHTIQQGHTVQRTPLVTTTVPQPLIQRSATGKILDWIADKANNIPGFRMFTIILGVNPVNMGKVDRSAANILRALVEFMPGGAIITKVLDNHGVFEKIAAWVENQIKSLGMVGQMFKNALTEFVDSLGWSDLASFGNVWERAKCIFTAPIDRLISFAKGVVIDILKFVKDAVLKPLAALAQGTRGYDLLKAILGEDPITGEPVPRNADTLIGGFMKLIGQEDVWENIKKGKAVARAWAWFQGALAGLMGLARAIPGKIISTINSLTFQDIITVAGAFGKIVGAFAGIATDFLSWGLNQVISLLEILFSVVAPGVMPYIKKAQSAFMTILKNPIGFVGNLVKAGKQGFQMFAGNILEHLKAALIKWLVGPLADAGVYIPKSFTLLEIIKLVLSVLGLTWQNIRAKLVKIIPEPVLVGLEKTAGILVSLVKDGPVAAWEQIKAELSELKEQLSAQITQMVSIEVVKAAVMKLVSMLNPAGAVVQAIIAIYNTITFFIEKIEQIAAVVASFIDSIAAIAAGQVANAAKKVEQTMANSLTVVIAFLAKFAGLGNIPAKVVGIIKKIRQPIDKGLDRIVAWLGGMLKKAGGVFGKKGTSDTRPEEEKKRDKLKAIAEAEKLLPGEGFVEEDVRRKLGAIKTRYRLLTLNLLIDSKKDDTQTVRFTASASKEESGKPNQVKTKFARYKVGQHTVTDDRIKGASHHVPVKVMKMWFGEVLDNASKQADDNDLRQRLSQKATFCMIDPEGKGLSAILLSEEDHVSVHGTKPTMNIPVIKTRKGEIATKPTKATIRGNVPSPVNVIGNEEKNPDVKALQGTFDSVYNRLLQVGLATVGMLKLKGKWRTDLGTLSGKTWNDYKEVPQKK